MSAKRFFRRAELQLDVEVAVEHHLREAGPRVAIGFLEAFEGALQRIAEYPSVGSNRYGHELNLSDLRAVLLHRYPYVVFYVDRDEHIDVWRLLHARRDLAASIRPPDDA